MGITQLPIALENCSNAQQAWQGCNEKNFLVLEFL